MSNVRVRWNLPTARVDGRPLPVAEIASTLVFIKVQGAPDFALLAEVLAPGVELVQTELEPGDYAFRVVVVDTQVPPKASAPVEATVNIPVPVLANPNPAGGLTLTVE